VTPLVYVADGVDAVIVASKGAIPATAPGIAT
jgi:hypothetical protein